MFTGQMIESGGERVVDLIWRLCIMAFESDVVPEDWRSAMTVPVYNGKGERTEHSNYRVISLLRVVGKIYVRILVYRVRKETKGLIGD